MSSVESIIASNLARIRERIDAACRRSGRAPTGIRLVAVTKSAEVSWIRTLAALGVHDLGESRPQQLAERVPLVDENVQWHLIGHLQRNKIRKVLPLVAWIHSVDSLSLLKRLDDIVVELALRPKVLLEVNVSGEGSKNGFRPVDLLATWPALAEVANVEIAGLMTMAPFSERAEDARPTFGGLRTLRDELVSAAPICSMSELSMGMSGDFEVAIEEGATIIRVGTSLFEGLPGSIDTGSIDD